MWMSQVVQKQQQLAKNREREQEVLVKSVQLFTTAYVKQQHTLQELLNDSFHSEMMDHLLENHIPHEFRERMNSSDGIQELLQLITKAPDLIKTEARAYGLQLALKIYQKNIWTCPNKTTIHECTIMWDCLFHLFQHGNSNTIDGKPSSLSLEVAQAMAKLLHHLVIRCEKGVCILHYLSQRSWVVHALLVHLDHEDIRAILLRIIYCDHSPQGLKHFFDSHIMHQLVERVATFAAPKEDIEVHRNENTGLLLREVVRAPYISLRGDAIYAQRRPRLKHSAADEFPSVCGCSGILASTSVRKFSSRKIQHLVSIFVNNDKLVEGVVQSALSELNFWLRPSTMDVFGARPKAAITLFLTQLVLLVKTVDFTERNGRGQFGVQCFLHQCSTHCIRKGYLKVRSRFQKQHLTRFVELNCLLGMRLRGFDLEKQQPLEDDSAFLTWQMADIESVEESDWTDFGICMVYQGRKELLAADSKEEQLQWIIDLRKCIAGNLPEIELVCTEDWQQIVTHFKMFRHFLEKKLENHFGELAELLIRENIERMGIHLVSLLWLFCAIVRLESAQMDACIAKYNVIPKLIDMYATFGNNTMVCHVVTRILHYIIDDSNARRGHKCPMLSDLFSDEENQFKTTNLRTLFSKLLAKSLPKDVQPFAQNLMHSVSQCYLHPSTQYQDAIREKLRFSDSWQNLCESLRDYDKVFVQDAVTNTPGSFYVSQPSFQADLLSQLFSLETHNGNMSFVSGKGCCFGYMYKKTCGNTWKNIIGVLERKSFKFWYSYVDQIEEGKRIPWKWIVPSDVQPRFCHGGSSGGNHSNSSSADVKEGQDIGHYGIRIKSTEKSAGKEVFLTMASFASRECWLGVLTEVTAATSQLVREFSLPSSMSETSSSNFCQSCHAPFNLYRHRHNCRRCGQCLCSNCSNFRKAIPEGGIFKPVRHCVACFEAAGGRKAETEPVLQMIGSSPLVRSLKGSQSSVDLYQLGRA